MSSIASAQSHSSRRPATIVGAAALAAVTALLYAVPWPGYFDPGVAVVAAAIAIEVIFLVGVAGLWQLRRWGLFVTIAVGSVNGIFNLLGALDPDASTAWVLGGVGIAMAFAGVVGLAASPSSRRAIS